MPCLKPILPLCRMSFPCIRFAVFLALCNQLSACTVIAIADAAVSTTVKVGSAVVGTAVDVTAAGVKAVTRSDPPAKKDTADQPKDD